MGRGRPSPNWPSTTKLTRKNYANRSTTLQDRDIYNSTVLTETIGAEIKHSTARCHVMTTPRGHSSVT